MRSETIPGRLCRSFQTFEPRPGAALDIAQGLAELKGTRRFGAPVFVMSLGRCCPLRGQLCELPKEVLSQILGLCRADFTAVRQVNRCLKDAVDLEVRAITVTLRSGSRAGAANAFKRKSPLDLQRKYPKLRQVRDG